MSDWYTEMFARVDDGDLEGYLESVSEDASVIFANNEPTVGKPAIRAMFTEILDALDGMTHHWEHAYTNGGDTTALEGRIAYHRKDGHTVELPVVTVLRRGDDGLVDQLRVYIDGTPTFAPVADAAGGD